MKKMLIYFILYTSSAFTNYFSKLMCFFFFLSLEHHTLSLSLKMNFTLKQNSVSPPPHLEYLDQCFQSYKLTFVFIWNAIKKECFLSFSVQN